jgi:hypothetical protein
MARSPRLDASEREPAFSEFYAEYLAHHRHPANRALHLAAKLLALGAVAAAAAARSPFLLLAAPALAVAPCWLGHLLFERNRPVSWTRPSASLLGTLWGWTGMARLARSARPAPAAGAARRSRRAGWRGYYSFLADLRMCGEMLSRKGAARASSART